MPSTSGQGTVEFCLVLGALILLLFAGFTGKDAIESGLLVEHAQQTSSYAIEQDQASALADAFVH